MQTREGALNKDSKKWLVEMHFTYAKEVSESGNIESMWKIKARGGLSS
jgi:hypothetical protein